MANAPQPPKPSANRVQEADEDEEEEEVDTLPTEFEEAISACGFGIFNVSLLFIAIFAVASTIFESTCMSYILPTAECDLHLSLVEKGFLNGVTYAGMIVSAVPWGYIADTMGRKRILVYGLVSNGVCMILAACSQNVMQLMIFKFFGGFIACGPFAVIMSYLSEFHGKAHRTRVMMIVGVMKTIALVVLPVLAYLILPNHIKFEISGFRFHTWQIFIGVCALPGLISGSLLSLFPESPKFLMAQGKNDDALKTFQIIYAVNTGKDKSTFPVKTLFDEAPEKTARREQRKESQRPKRSKRQRARSSFGEGMRQLKPMFSRSYLGLAVVVYLMDFCVLAGQNSIRLWLPQIFASIVEYQKIHSSASSMCAILDYNVNKTKTVLPSGSCDVHISPASYTNNIIVAGTGFIGFILASMLVHKVGNRNILSFVLIVSSLCGSALYWSTSELSTLILAAIFVTNSSVAGTTLISVAVSVFPTTMRTTVIILIMTFGRAGSLIGNIIFPIFISMGCIPPFVMVGSCLFCAFVISMFLPNTHKMSLK